MTSDWFARTRSMYKSVMLVLLCVMVLSAPKLRPSFGHLGRLLCRPYSCAVLSRPLSQQACRQPVLAVPLGHVSGPQNA